MCPTAVWAHKERSFGKFQDHYLIYDLAVMESRSRSILAVLVILGSLKVSWGFICKKILRKESALAAPLSDELPPCVLLQMSPSW